MRSTWGPIVIASLASHGLTASYDCMPDAECWPTKAEWTAFNETLGGMLKITHPYAEPCYADSSSDACLAVAEGYSNSTGAERTSVYGETTNLNWEVCGADQCLLNSLDPLSGISGTCKLGRLSAYYVEAHNAAHVQATLEFVKAHNIRLSIKNTGHDYFGRSTTANSLALWTHNMKATSFEATFQPQGCSADKARQNIGIIGAGVSAAEAYTFFQTHDMHPTVGAVASVGIAGGFGQGGGHGPLGPSYGLMVDQAVEFDVVTASGEAKTINECSDPDLFWAMRGGGGGTYAVLLNYKFQLHAALPMNVYAFAANISKSAQSPDLTKSKVHRDIVTSLANNQTTWSNNRVAGYNFFLPTNVITVQILPSADTDALKTLTKDWHDFLTAYDGLDVIANEYATLNTYPEYSAYMLPFLATNGPLGVGIEEASRLIPRSQFQGPENVDALVDAFLQGLNTSLTLGAGLGTGSGQIYATGPANQPDNSATGVNPAWRGSLWEIIHGGIWLSTDSEEERKRVQNTASKAIKGFVELTAGGGTYMNEGDVLEEEWEQTFFGGNYEKLLEVKRTYDPTGLFRCYKCVGFEESDQMMLGCYTGEGPPTTPLEPEQNSVTAGA